MISEQRRFLNEFLIPRWKETIPSGSLIYDIGATHDHDYRSLFSGFTYRTVDRDITKEPDILMNLELCYLPPAQAILFNGVFEQSDDPFALWRNILNSLAPGGTVLAGLASIGMPPYGEFDKWRLTEDGARVYIRPLHITHFTKLPEYFYVIANLRN